MFHIRIRIPKKENKERKEERERKKERKKERRKKERKKERKRERKKEKRKKEKSYIHLAVIFKMASKIPSAALKGDKSCIIHH